MNVDAATDRLRHRLLWRIMERYAVVTEPMRIGPITLEFTRIADPNRVLDEVAREEDLREKHTGSRKPEDELSLPYWAELWESSIGLAYFLVDQWAHCGAGGSAVAALARASLKAGAAPPEIMDLGCGMGLAGAAAARLGLPVLFADIETHALLFARLNTVDRRRICRYRRVNWQRDRIAQRFSLILGADILYDRAQWEHLHDYFVDHVAAAGSILLGEPGRSSGEEFEPWIMARGWRLLRRQQTIPNRAEPIRLFELSR